MTLEDRLRSVPKSYDDFVRYAMECMEEDDAVRDLLERQFMVKPDSDVNDITKILCDHRGVGEPLEIVDDEKPAPSSRIKVAMF